MPLVDCRSCKNQVSEDAAICVHCGAGGPGKIDRPKKNELKDGGAITCVLVVLIIISWYVLKQIY